MAWFKAFVFTTFLAGSLIEAPPSIDAADWGDWNRGNGKRGACRHGDRIAIQDLDVLPDPLIEGQRIRMWKVRIQLDGNRDCNTEIEIREGGEAVGRARRTTLHPGITEVDVEAIERYRFHGREHCFNVVVDLEGTKREADASRRFCALQKAAWSMRERNDSGRR
jgi:hypothetical protein